MALTDIENITFIQNMTKDKIAKLKGETKITDSPVKSTLLAEMCDCFDALVTLTEQHKKDT